MISDTKKVFYGKYKIFFRIFMFLVVSTGLFMGGKFLTSLYRYFQMSHETTTHIDTWSIEEIKPGKFIIQAEYELKIGEKVFRNQYIFLNPIYSNDYLPKLLIEKWKIEPQKVWYNVQNPAYATLQKKIPLKEGIYFVLCVGLFFYSIWIRIYIRKIPIT